MTCGLCALPHTSFGAFLSAAARGQRRASRASPGGGGGRGGPQAHFVVLWVLVVAFLQCGRMHPSDVPLLVAVAGVHEPNIVRHFALPQAQPYVPPRAREVVY